MAEESAKIKIGGDAQQVTREFNRVSQGMDKVVEQLKNIEKVSRDNSAAAAARWEKEKQENSQRREAHEAEIRARKLEQEAAHQAAIAERAEAKATAIAEKEKNRLLSERQERLRAIGSFVRTAGATIAGFGAKAGYEAIESLKEARREMMDFEREITPVLSLGGNVNNIDAVKRQILDMSGALGISRQVIADTMFSVQSGAANLSKSVQDKILRSALQLSKVTGTDLNLSLTALLKSFQIYGKEVGSVDAVQGKMFATAERGWMTFEDLAQLLPDVANSSKAMKYSFDDLLGTLVVATQVGGRNEKTFTGVRNVLLRMGKAVEEGLVPNNGKLIDQLQALEKVDGQKLKDIFGDEAISVAASLAQNVGRVREEIGKIQAVSTDQTTEKYLKRLGDEAYRVSESIAAIQQMQKNIPASENYAKNFGGVDREYELRRLGFRSIAPQFLHGGSVEGAAVIGQMAIDRFSDALPWWAYGWTREGADRKRQQDKSLSGSRLFKEGQAEYYDTLERTGEKARATYESVKENMPGASDAEIRRIAEGILKNSEAFTLAIDKLTRALNDQNIRNY